MCIQQITLILLCYLLFVFPQAQELSNIYIDYFNLTSYYNRENKIVINTIELYRSIFSVPLNKSYMTSDDYNVYENELNHYP